MVRTVVYRKGVFHSVEGELAEGDTVRVASRNLSGTWAVSEVAHRVRISEHHVSEDSVLVRNHYRNDTGSDV